MRRSKRYDELLKDWHERELRRVRVLRKPRKRRPPPVVSRCFECGIDLATMALFYYYGPRQLCHPCFISALQKRGA